MPDLPASHALLMEVITQIGPAESSPPRPSSGRLRRRPGIIDQAALGAEELLAFA
jgi:hypothetical protein